MNSFYTKNRKALRVVLLGLLMMPLIAQARVDATSVGLAVRVAPGELLPISVKLSNFGGGSRVDVFIRYEIFASTEGSISTTSETVAVETTASFIKKVPVPFGTAPGTHIARTTITYGGQLVPAVSEFHFTVERKILGLFQSDFIFYGAITLLFSVTLVVIGRMLINRRRTRFAPMDYSNIPHGKRTFYEIVSDTIMQMRGRVGDEALAIASHVEGLKINSETGRVISLTGSPAKIVAKLVSEYEKLLGKKVSFLFRAEK